ncbi:MAG: lipopolysaccharide biosynthesis, partial [Paracoccaceae bacterium]|nr:lipopolysaccharide biosynthesis [Paracoccaceae bacterium]
MILLFLSASIAGLIIAQRLPPMYSTSATLLVESAQITESAGQSASPTSASDQLRVIQQRLLTRANLIDIANEVQVFSEQGAMNPDEVVEAMREASVIELTVGRDQANLMRLGFTADNPVKAAEVINRYVDIALELSSSATISQAEDTLAFHEQELRRYSDELDIQSGIIADFKRENADALPENLDYNQTRQSLLQERVSRAERELNSLATQRTNILRVFEATGSVTAPGPLSLSNEEQLLIDLESELSVARSIYSPSNPRVRNLVSQVEALRSRMEAAALEAPETQPTPPTAQRTALEISLAEIDSRTETLREEVADANAELLMLRESIAQIPANGIILSGLEREQENIQNLYDATVGRLAQAQSSLNIIAAAKGERITVLEAASVPSDPSSPNRFAIVMMATAIGIGLAGGFFLLLEMLNQTVRRQADIVKNMGIVPLAVIPQIETIGQRRLRRGLQVVASLAVIASVPAIRWAIASYVLPL